MSRMTPAQAGFWARLRRHDPSIPERFTPGDYRCPAHKDDRASLSVGYEGNRVLFHCQAGCAREVVRRRLGIAWVDLDDYGPALGKRHVATYTYTDAAGAPELRVFRFEPKDFRVQRFEDGEWLWGRGKAPYRLYNLARVVEAVQAGERVWLVEGEKDADAMERAGAAATTTPGGAGKTWRPEYTEALRGAYVTIVADCDEAGRRHARKAYAELAEAAAEVVLVEPNLNRPHADASDHLAAGLGLDDFAPLAPGDAPAAEAAPAEPVPLEEGGELLDEIEAFLRRFVVFATDAQALVAALWVAHTWCFEAAETTPYLHVTSPEKRSGKSRLVEVLAQLVRGALQAADMTAAALYRSITDPAPTVLFDEVQEMFGRGADDDQRQLRACLNSGYRLGGAARRCVGEGAKQTVAEFPTFCPKVLAGTGSLPDMLADRAIPIRLHRKTRHERVERFRIRRIRSRAEALRRRLAGWAQVAVPVLHDAEPELPDQLDDRAQDCWEALLALADLAGGDWPKRARAAAVEAAGGDRLADPSVGALLLGHCREAFAGEGADRLPTARLLELLCARDDGPWAERWAKYAHDGHAKVAAVGLAKLLRPFGIAPKVLDFEGKKARGYSLSAFGDAFGRYLPDHDPPPAPLPRNLPGQGALFDVTESRPVTSTDAADQQRYGVRPSAQQPGPSRLRTHPGTTGSGRHDAPFCPVATHPLPALARLLLAGPRRPD
jgi:5S rRNA maturation endonuclease (ribonuclease M5)